MKNNRHSDRLKNAHPERTSQAVALYRQAQLVRADIKKQAVRLAYSSKSPDETNELILSRDGAMVYWLLKTKVVYVYFLPDLEDENENQIGPQMRV